MAARLKKSHEYMTLTLIFGVDRLNLTYSFRGDKMSSSVTDNCRRWGSPIFKKFTTLRDRFEKAPEAKDGKTLGGLMDNLLATALTANSLQDFDTKLVSFVY